MFGSLISIHARYLRALGALTVACALSLLPAADTQPVYYWNGDQQVELDLALNEIEVEDAAGRRSVALAPVAADGFTATAQRMAKDPGVRVVRAVLYHRGVKRSEGSRHVATGRLSLRVHAGQDLPALLARHALQLVEHVPYSPDTIIAEVVSDDPLAAIKTANRLVEQEGVVFASPLLERQLQRRGDPDDAQYPNQWHLRNTNQLGGGTSGNDLNVRNVWNFAAGTGLGTGINIAIVDDGLETTHPDLIANVRTDIDIDINYGDNDPTPAANNVGDNHGTWVGGMAAARGNNGIGTSGVAPRAGLVGVRIISAPVSDAQEAQAIVHRASEAVDVNRVHVSNNSWGPQDFGGVLGAPGPLLRAALESGTTNGRGGLGIVYCWAAGNGGLNVLLDVANYDGYANSRFVIAVAASRHDGQKASYSEPGTNILINAPGGGLFFPPEDDPNDIVEDDGPNLGLVVTDRTGALGQSTGDFTRASDSLGGTSFATPAVAGVVALVLEANPALTWRDVRHVLVRTATKNDGGDSGWITNGAGKAFNRKHGFGRINALAAVTAAAPGTWVPVPAEVTALTASETATISIPDADVMGISRTRTIAGPADFRVEFVELTVSASHLARGHVRFRLTSPDGTISDFSRRPNDDGDNFSNWTFGSVVHLGEDPNGTWTLQVSDEVAGETGSLTKWSLRIHGYRSYSMAPTLSTVAPNVIAQGASDTSISVTGANFVVGASRVRWNGLDLATTVTSTTQATAMVPAANLASAGSVTVTVVTPPFDAGDPTLTSSGVVVAISAAPSITSVTPSPASTAEDTAVVLTVTAVDGDTAAGSLIFSATSSEQTVAANSNLVFSGSGFSRTLTVTPVPDASGISTLTIMVSDGASSTATTVTLTVIAANDPPVATGGRFRTAVATQLSGSVGGYDPDGDALSYAVVATTTQGTLVLNANGSFTYQPIAGFRGVDVFTYQITANTQTSAVVQAFITVAGDPSGARPLIVSEPSDEQIAVGDAFTYQVLADTRRYAAAPALAYTLVGAPVGMVINATTGLITWTAAGADRHLMIGIVVADSVTGAFDTQTVVLRVVATGATN